VKKIFYVAAREFTATVLTKGFIFGMLITPLIIGLVVVVFPKMINRTPPKIEGQLAIVDPTGEVSEGFGAYLAPERFAERNEETKRRIAEETSKVLGDNTPAARAAQDASRKSLQTALGEAPRLEILRIPASVDVETAKAPLKESPAKGAAATSTRLALVVVHKDAVRRAEGSTGFGSYDLYVRGKIDDRLIDGIRDALRDSIVEARVKASGLDRKEIEALTKVDRPPSRTVTSTGERATNEVFNMLLPAGFMVLLLMSVLTGGQYLLTSTVEEKSNRVVEVLLSAVSSMELMVGKILGQLAVGLLVLALYAGLGVVALISFAMLGLLDPMLIGFLVIFYLLAYFTVASFMAAIGSAVNEMREAQTMMTPVMLVVMIPWILWLPISRDPNSTLATVLSFIPPMSNFVMLLRMSSSAPPPMWQTWLSVLAGLAGVYAAVWFAAKVFRVGLLMFGKPPDLKTLVRWARMS
jgi:ABC-2 type transport system permease protein